jgi:membrane protease YdiL (CAAX protease family)
MVVVVWGPFAEEVFFRGFLLAALLPALGPTRAAAVSSAIFAGAHLTLSTMMPIFVTGMLLSWLYLRSRSIWPPFMAHAVQNLAAVAFTP